MMEKINIMENKRFNTMGSEVVDGFTCKPKKLIPNKPIMHYKSHILLCEGQRCKKACKNDILADTIRGYIKDIGHSKSDSRIKITRANCFGACRFRQTAVVFENTKANGFIPNNGVFLRNVHKFDEEKWKELFYTLINNIDLEKSKFKLIPMKEIEQ